jgi:WD40 repeat protein
MAIRKILLALLGLLALVGCAPTGSTPAAMPTPQPPALELTYIGSDGNVWQMAWPGGTPEQFTNDAQANQVRYSGLAWSPDGARLAVLRETGPLGNPTADLLVLFAPDGRKLAQVTLSGQPENTPLAWSPDGKLIAYRTETGQLDPVSGSIKGRLTILDAQTAAAQQTLLYDKGPGGGCGGAFPPLQNAVMAAHNAYASVDTFAWTPDQQGLLLARGCGNTGGVLVDLRTGKTTPGYPAGASYQPGSNLLILGQWHNHATITLGLADATGAQQKTLVSETVPQNGPPYDTLIGVATWSRDGQTIYYEHDNSIWSVGANGSNNHQIVAGAPNDSHNQATVVMLPRLSPDGSLLLYLQLRGANGAPGSSSVTSQCYVARPDGSHAAPLPPGATGAVWRPVK